MFFPEHNVRYIAVNDGVDTVSKTAMDITPFRNILNEMYSADVSVKIKSAYRARFNQGKFMGTTAPYGYRKDPEDKNHLLIDERVAPVVRKIFELALEGNGILRIRNWLNHQNFLRPAAYSAEQGNIGYERYFENNEENRYIWSENSVRQILRSPIYAGNLVGYKRPVISMKSKKRPSRLPEEWEVIPNTHEGIVSQETFDTVQQMITSRRKKNSSGYNNIFAGVIGSYTRYGTLSCTSHKIEARDLYNAVLADINYYANMALKNPKAVTEIQQKLSAMDKTEFKAFSREKRKLEKRLMELDRLFSSLYEDKVMGRITERNFLRMSEKYEKEQFELDLRLKEIEAELSAKGLSDKGAVDFVSLIKQYQGITELTATTVNALIDKIVVSEHKENADGVMEQCITIYYKFVGSLHEFYIPVPKRTCFFGEKVCTRCGTEYIPNSNVARYCPDCRKIVKREHEVRSNEVRKAKRHALKAQAEKEKAISLSTFELSAKDDRLTSSSRREESYVRATSIQR